MTLRREQRLASKQSIGVCVPRRKGVELCKQVVSPHRLIPYLVVRQWIYRCFHASRISILATIGVERMLKQKTCGLGGGRQERDWSSHDYCDQIGTMKMNNAGSVGILFQLSLCGRNPIRRLQTQRSTRGGDRWISGEGSQTDEDGADGRALRMPGGIESRVR